ncbi:hypothetical protein C2845_PM11G09200 [Panicum miliaceum]|uniref:CDC48 N-terminal subdomain domain-containing protein n=1 Tax=Panicum miliaceum TaxID=4540 RepID=A0A3L6RV45_PANMI|nr:hypothetical protein C2845_PM11G09200 [Panicum miliaceum]
MKKTTKAANRLVVEEAAMDDVSVCPLHPATMDRLSIYQGDVVLLKGNRCRDTVCLALPDEECPEHALRIGRATRSNLQVRLADVVFRARVPRRPVRRARARPPRRRHRRGPRGGPRRGVPQAPLPRRLPPAPLPTAIQHHKQMAEKLLQFKSIMHAN